MLNQQLIEQEPLLLARTVTTTHADIHAQRCRRCRLQVELARERELHTTLDATSRAIEAELAGHFHAAEAAFEAQRQQVSPAERSRSNACAVTSR